FILLLGPILEEKYGSVNLLFMIIITALATGIASILLSNITLLGASGLVFMMILLSSFVNVQKGDMPLTFLLVLLIYLLREFLTAFQTDSISQLAHIVGGAVGSIFGFVFSRRIRA
ncbi:MAG: rhomboid family intramembrane serine protease, partial [Salinispira sp.]